MKNSTFSLAILSSLGLSLAMSGSVGAATGLFSPSPLAAVTSASGVVLTWSDPNNRESGYYVERRAVSVDKFVQIANVGASVTRYVDTGPKSGSYYYRVRAYKTASTTTYSNYSNNVAISLNSASTSSATTSTPTSFNITAGPTALNLTTSSALIQWSLASVGTGQVQYGPTTSYGKLTTPELSFKYSTHNQPVSGLAAGTTYHYRVVSKNAAGVQVVSPDATFATVATTTAPPRSSPPPPPATTARYIGAYHPFTSSFLSTLAEYGATRSCIVYQTVIDSNKDGIFDGVTSSFKSRVEACPVDYNGPLALDWENAYGISQGFVRALSGKDGASIQQAAITEAVKVVKAAKALRPNAKVGFYNVPYNGGSYKTPLNAPAWWWNQVTTLAPLVAVSDALYPSMYQPYKIGTGGQISLADDQTVEGNYAKLSLMAAKGKPVYPFVWELYHNSALSINQTLIPPQELYWHIQGAMNANVNGATVAGLYWWGMGAGPDGTEPSLKAFRQALDGKPFQP